MTFALAFNDGYRLSRLQHLVKKLETHVMETIGVEVFLTKNTNRKELTTNVDTRCCSLSFTLERKVSLETLNSKAIEDPCRFRVAPTLCVRVVSSVRGTCGLQETIVPLDASVKCPYRFWIVLAPQERLELPPYCLEGSCCYPTELLRQIYNCIICGT